MGQKAERDAISPSAQAQGGESDGKRVESIRSSLHRLAPVALMALGILGALLTIFAGLVALNHSILPFKGWPLDGERFDTGAQVLPRAPVASAGRLRAAPGGALAAALRGASPVLRATAASALVPVPRVTVVQIRHGAAHPIKRRPAATPAPVATPSPQTTTPVTQPSTPVASPAPAATPVVSTPAPAARQPVVASRRPVTGATTSTSTSTAHGNGRGHAHGHAHAPGQLKKVAVAAAPAAVPAAAPATPVAPVPGEDDGPGNSHGHGPPPWAHGHH
jgi:hypothetical protein